jgi:hypothetical protein
MIPYDIDPSLHTAEPEPPLLDDGFSPPHHDEIALTAEVPAVDVQPGMPLPVKSPF